MSPGPTFGPYPTRGVLGSGGMGVVYLADDPKLGRELAIKTLSRGANADETQRRRFQREARALAELSHPGLVSIVDAGVQDGVPWLAMLRVRGETLESRIRSKGLLNNSEAADLGCQLCSALGAAHLRGILHRDLKPDNVLVTPGGHYVITDFGLTKDLVGPDSGPLSQTGALIGTPGYWAPEQAMGRSSQATAATDVYGVGAVLYAALTGVPPIAAPSLLEAVVATQERPPEPPSNLAPVSPGLEAVILRCLEKSPQDRYDSVDVLEEALRELSRQSSSGPGRGLLLGLGAVLAFLVGVLAVWLIPGGVGSASPTPPQPAHPGSSPTPPPSSPTPLAPRVSPGPDAEARVRRALEEGAWAEGHAALGEDASLESVWLRYLLLRDEVEARGQATPEWIVRKRRAEELAAEARRAAEASAGAVWARGLAAMTGLLKDPFLEPTREVLVNYLEWETDLERAASAGPTEGERAAALAQALATLSLLRAAAGPRRSEAVERARARIEACARFELPRWKSLFLSVRLELFVAGATRELALGIDELERLAAEAGLGWLRAATNFFRGELCIGFARSDQETLWRSLASEIEAPRVLRGHAANRLAALLLEQGKLGECREALEHAASFSDGGRGSVGRDQALLLAWSQIRGGVAKSALETLGGLSDAEPPTARARLLEGLALAHLGRRSEARERAGQVRDGDLRRDRVLILELAALTAAPVELEGVLERLLSGASALEALACLDRLEDLLLAPGVELEAPEVLRRFVARAQRQRLAPIERVVEEHLQQGLWVLAARRVEQALGGAKGAQAELRTRLDYRILRRARDQVRPEDPLFKQLLQRAVAAARQGLDPSQAHHTGLLGALLTQGPTAHRVALKDIRTGAQSRPQWWEFYDAGDSGLWARRERRPEGERSRRFVALENLREWRRARPKDPRALWALTRWSPPQVTRELLQKRDFSDPIVGPLLISAYAQARVATGVAPLQEGVQTLTFVAHSGYLLTRQRAEVLLDLAELQGNRLGDGSRVLATLELLRAWCGKELGDHARYQTLRAEALLRLGRSREGLRAAKAAATEAREAHAELRERAQAVLGWAEVACGTPSGGVRAGEAAARAPSFAAWLSAARASQGAEAERRYAEALSRLLGPEQVEPFWEEVLGADLDGNRVLRLALRHFEGRGDPSARVVVALSLFRRLGDASSAQALWQAMIQFRLAGGSPRRFETAGRNDTFGRARALLPEHLRRLVQALEGALNTVQNWAPRAERVSSKDVLRAFEALDVTTRQISAQEANDFWIVAARGAARSVLAGALPRGGYLEVLRAELRSARETRRAEVPSLRLEFWISRLEAALGDPEQQQSLDRALADARDYAELRRLIQLERGLSLRRAGRNEEALVAYDELIYGEPNPRWQILGLALKAQVLRHMGPKGRERQALALARAQALGGLAVPRDVHALLLLATAQAQLDRGEFAKTRSALAAANEILSQIKSVPLEQERDLVRATLARREGDPQLAWSLLEGADLKGAFGVRRERALTLRDLERVPEAISFLEEVLIRQPEGPDDLYPIERVDLEALLKELRAGQR